MSIKALLIGVLAIIGLGVLGSAILSGGSVDAHGGDDSVLHVCVGKWGSLRAAYVVSPNGNCPSALFDQVHLEMEGPATPSIALPQSCPAGEFVNGIAADGSLMCEPVITADSFYMVVVEGEDLSEEAECDPGDVVTGGGFFAAGDGAGGQTLIRISAPDLFDKDGWVVEAYDQGGALTPTYDAYAVCLDLAPFRP